MSTSLTSFVFILTVCARVLLVSAARSKSEDKDSFVFPNDESLQRQKFHDPTFHEYHSRHPGRSDFQHSPKFHQHVHRPDFFKYDLTSTTEGAQILGNDSINEIPLSFIHMINQHQDNPLMFIEGVDSKESDETALFDKFNDEERSSAVAAKAAFCKPELQVIRLVENQEPNVLYFPQCTRIERCGGCCNHRLLKCQPTEFEIVNFSVTKTRYSPGTSRLKPIEKEIISVERHTKCLCDCITTADDCNQLQHYRKSECKCICKNTDEEKKCYKNNATKLWDPDQCRCICRETRMCSTGFEFDPFECICVPKTIRNNNYNYKK